MLPPIVINRSARRELRDDEESCIRAHNNHMVTLTLLL